MKNLKELQNLLKIFDTKENKRTIFASDLNTIFNSKLEAKHGKQLPKRKSIAKLVNIKESLNISNILNIRNRKSQNFAFR